MTQYNWPTELWRWFLTANEKDADKVKALEKYLRGLLQRTKELEELLSLQKSANFLLNKRVEELVHFIKLEIEHNKDFIPLAKDEAEKGNMESFVFRAEKVLKGNKNE